MANNIVRNSGLPRAIAKEKDGIVLYWVEELGVAGLHQAGLASLFGCGEPTVKRIIERLSSGNDNLILSAEIVTPQGLRVVTLVSERGFTKFCRLICESKASQISKDKAWDLAEKFAAAGFKLMVMMELAPAELAARAVDHHDREMAALRERRRIAEIETQGKSIELRRSEVERDTLLFRDLVVKTCPEYVQQKILGYQTIETTKFRDRIIDENDRIVNTVDTVSKTELAYRYGFVNKNGKPDTKLVATLIDEAIAAGVIPNPWHDVRVVASSGFEADLVPILDRFQKASPVERQRWIGE